MPLTSDLQERHARAWLVLGMLLCIYIVNFLDRQLVAILAKPIQDELQVTDRQLGLVGGLYFAVFYCVIAVPVGWLADRTNRVRVLACACCLWSAATIACGFSASYAQLVAARMAVGVGEAGGVPPSYSIIADYFPPGLRGTAFGIYNFGPPLGQALGIAFGASIAATYEWRMAFVMLGAVGIGAALLLLLWVREPVRGQCDPAFVPDTSRAVAGESGMVSSVRRFFSRPVLVYVSLAAGSAQFVTYATLNFTPLFLMREKGMRLSEVAVYYALLVGVALCAGMYASGRLVDYYGQQGKGAYALIPAVAFALALPGFVAFTWAPTWPGALLCLVVPTFLSAFALSPAVALVQEEVGPDERVLAGALLLLVMNLIGLGLGPTYLGVVSDLFRASHPNNSLQVAFYTLAPFHIVTVVLFLLLRRRVCRETIAVRAG